MYVCRCNNIEGNISLYYGHGRGTAFIRHIARNTYKLKTHTPRTNCTFSFLPIGKTLQLLDFSGGLHLTSSIYSLETRHRHGYSVKLYFRNILSSKRQYSLESCSKVSLRGYNMQYCSTVIITCGNYSYGMDRQNFPLHYERKFISLLRIPTTHSKL